jgi:hypothetical protein
VTLNVTINDKEMLVVKPWFDEVGCEYVGMEGKRSLFITLGSRKYSWFHTESASRPLSGFWQIE